MESEAAKVNQSDGVAFGAKPNFALRRIRKMVKFVSGGISLFFFRSLHVPCEGKKNPHFRVLLWLIYPVKLEIASALCKTCDQGWAS